MMQVPLTALPAQTLGIILANQNCGIALSTLPTGLYFDLTLDSTPIVTKMICRNGARLLLDRQYLGFVGDFIFVDTQAGNGIGQDPIYAGLGTRYQLLYLEVADLV